MKPFFTILLVIVCLSSFKASAQSQDTTTQDSSLSSINLKTVNLSILSTTDRSYITAAQGIGNNKIGHNVSGLEPLIFEAKISPNYFIRLYPYDHLAISVNPGILIRMFQEDSNPIYTP